MGRLGGYFQCRGARLQPMYCCCLKGLAPLLFPGNGILEGLEGKAGLGGGWGGCPCHRAPNWAEQDVPPLPALTGTLIQALISSSDLGTKREMVKPLSFLPEGPSPSASPCLQLQRPLLPRDQESVRELRVIQLPHLRKTKERMWSS